MRTPLCIISAFLIASCIVSFPTQSTCAAERPKDAKAWLAEARKSADALKNLGAKVDALSGIAEVEAGMGDVKASDKTLAQASALALKIDDSYDRSQAFHAILKVQAKRKMLSEASATLKKIEDTEDKVYALCELGIAYSKAGKNGQAAKIFSEALKNSRVVECELAQGEMRSAIAEAQAECGMFSDAVATADDTKTLCAIAIKYQKAGLRAEAQKLMATAEAGIKMSKDEMAPLQTEEGADNLSDVVDTLCAVAEAQKAIGNKDRAAAHLATAKSLILGMKEFKSADWYRSWTLKSFVASLVACGNLDEAEALMNRMHDPEMKAFAMAAVASGYAKAGDRERALNILLEAAAVAKKAEDPWDVASEIFQAEVELSMYTRALEIADKIGFLNDKAFGCLGLALAKAGKTDRLEEAFKHIKGPGGKISYCLGAARGLAAAKAKNG
jgi:tetratricopeptide (TPR) repeat protein